MNAIAPPNVWRAPAKINISLEVTAKRADGFHDLVSIMQTVDLWDTVELSESSSLQFDCSEPSLVEDNLVARAAGLLASAAPGRGCTIYLRKGIPTGAGMGGGSSDAAAALVALNAFWSVGAGCDQLRRLAEQLGSDVPYFLYGGTALVQGRGERVTPLPSMASAWWLLVNPGFAVSTAAVFREVRQEEWSSGDRTRDLAHDVMMGRRPAPGPNSLQAALFRLYPEAERCFNVVAQIAPSKAFVTGSGPTVCAVFEDRIAAERSCAALRPHGYWTAVVPTYVPHWNESPCR